MAEAVANQEHGITILANINNLFLCIVVDIRNIFSAWEACTCLFLLVTQKLLLAEYTVLC